MARRVLTDTQGGFSGGIQSIVSSYGTLPKGRYSLATNVNMTVLGDLVKRTGTRRAHAVALGAPSVVRGGAHWADYDFQVFVANGRVHTARLTSGLFTATPDAWGSNGDLSTTVYPSFAAFRDANSNAMYIADGGPLNKLEHDGVAPPLGVGTVTANIAGAASVSQICVYNLRLWGAGDSANPQTLYWSALGNGDTLGNTGSSGGSAIIRTFAHQDITALLPLGTSLIIFHETGISRFTGWSQDDFDVDTGTSGISSDTGTIAPRSIVAVENVAYFVAERGIYRLTESGVDLISENILGSYGTIDMTNASLFVSFHDKASRQVIFQLGGATRYVYNYGRGVFVGTHSSASANTQVWSAAWGAVDTSNNPVVLFSGNTANLTTHVGFVSVYPVSGFFRDDLLSDSSGGTVFSTVIVPRPLFFDSPFSVKRFHQLYLYAGLSTATIDFSVDDSITAGTGTFSSSDGNRQFDLGYQSGGIGGESDTVGHMLTYQISESVEQTASYSDAMVEAIDYGERY